MKWMRVSRRVTSGAFKYSAASSRARLSALPFGTTSATTPHSYAVRAGSGCGLIRNASARPGPRRNSHGKVADILECRTFSRHHDASEERVVRVDMGASLDGRDHRNADVRNVLQNLGAFVVNSAPDTRI